MGLFDDLDKDVAQPTAPSTGVFSDIETPPPVAPKQAEMRSYTPSPSERVANWLQDRFIGMGAQPYVAGHLGKGIRDIAQTLTPAGVAMSGADVQHYAGQGDFTNAGISALGVIPAGPIGKAAVSGSANTIRQMPPNFAEDVTRQFRPSPTGEQSMGSGATGFKEYVGSGQTYPNQDVAQFVQDAKKTLSASGKYAESSGADAHVAFDKLAEKTKTKPFIEATDIDELRQALSGAKGDPAAMQGRTLLYDYLGKTGDTTMERAVQNYGGGKRTEMVERILANSEMAKNPDVALANKLRSEVQKLDVRPRGFNEEEVAALDKARTAGSTREKLGSAALKYGAAPTTLGSTGALTAAFLGLVDPVTAFKTVVAPAAVGTAGGLLKASGAAARRRATQEAADLVARRTPMYQEAAAAAPNYPTTAGQQSLMRNAITQQLINQGRDPNEQEQLGGYGLPLYDVPGRPY